MRFVVELRIHAKETVVKIEWEARVLGQTMLVKPTSLQRHVTVQVAF